MEPRGRKKRIKKGEEGAESGLGFQEEERVCGE